MAKAEARTVTKTRTKQVEEKYTEKDGVTLTLDKREAEVLYRVLGKIGGDSFFTERTITDGLYDALYYAGVRGTKVDLEGSLRFVTLNPFKSAHNPSFA
jgi:hypothetical protein